MPLSIFKPLVFTFLSLLLFVPVTVNTAHAAPEKSFDNWLSDLRADARKQGVSDKVIEQALSDIKFLPNVIKLDRKQPEGTITFEQYKQRVITKARIEKGRRLYKQYKDTPLAENSAKRYGVPLQYIIALWAIETSYGANTGGFDVVEALATLAYDGRRSAFFRKELMTALKIIDEGHISAADMKGSWAGAMGQNQFMPSSFMSLAVDGNGDGRKDIWNDLGDVFASSAHYLHKNGWKEDERWGREVLIPSGFGKDMLGKEKRRSLTAWRDSGVKLPNGDPIPVADGMKGYLVAPDGIGGQVFLVYGNYDVFLSWNRSTYFASSVGLIADAIVQ